MLSIESEQLPISVINPVPSYKIRKSKKAKRIFLRIAPGKGLEVVVPEKLRHYCIEELLSAHKAWINKTLLKYQIDPTKYCAPEKNALDIILPKEYSFEAVQKKIIIMYHKEPRAYLQCQIVQQPKTITDTYTKEYWFIKGDIDNKVACQQMLHKMLKKEAQKYLVSWLEKISADCQLPFSSVQIRLQSSLWGSCTRLNKISLNAKLLFLEPRLAQYVLIHELCHTKYLNHSKRFWLLVGKFDPDFQLHRRLLKDAAKFIM